MAVFGWCVYCRWRRRGDGRSVIVAFSRKECVWKWCDFGSDRVGRQRWVGTRWKAANWLDFWSKSFANRRPVHFHLFYICKKARLQPCIFPRKSLTSPTRNLRSTITPTQRQTLQHYTSQLTNWKSSQNLPLPTASLLTSVGTSLY